VLDWVFVKVPKRSCQANLRTVDSVIKAILNLCVCSSNVNEYRDCGEADAYQSNHPNECITKSAADALGFKKAAQDCLAIHR